MMKKKLQLLLSLGFLFAAGSATAQINYTENFDDASHDWGLYEFEDTTVFPCDGAGALRVNLWWDWDFEFGVYQAEADSPSLGVSNGEPLTLTFDYKLIDYQNPLTTQIATDDEWGFFEVYYSTDPVDGDWTLVGDMTDVEHIPMTNCTTFTATFTPPAGEEIYIAIYAEQWDGDYFMYIDDFSAVQAPTAGTGSFNSAAFKHYPNPVKDVLNLSYSNEISTVEVYNLVGQRVLSTSVNATEASVDTSKLAAGSYIVKVHSGNAVQAVKIVKQ